MTNQEAINYLQQLYPNGGHCWLDEQRIEAIGMAVKALQEEPLIEDLEEAVHQYYKPNETFMDGFKKGAKWKEQLIMKDAVDACVTDIRTYKEDNEVDFTVMYEKGIIPYEIEQEVKLIIIKED